MKLGKVKLVPRHRGMCSVEPRAPRAQELQIFGIKSHRSPSYVVPSLAEHGGDEMHGVSMYVARWMVHLHCLQTVSQWTNVIVPRLVQTPALQFLRKVVCPSVSKMCQ